jgi:hypothetical protein
VLHQNLIFNVNVPNGGSWKVSNSDGSKLKTLERSFISAKILPVFDFDMWTLTILELIFLDNSNGRATFSRE